MRDPRRIDRIIDILRIIWKLAPDLRLGQLLITCGFSERNFFAREDDETEQNLLEELYIRIAKEHNK